MLGPDQLAQPLSGPGPVKKWDHDLVGPQHREAGRCGIFHGPGLYGEAHRIDGAEVRGMDETFQG